MSTCPNLFPPVLFLVCSVKYRMTKALCIWQILEDAPSLRESSEHSCSSSVIDEEAQARRCPTVVARLMGLDSMPAAS